MSLILSGLSEQDISKEQQSILCTVYQDAFPFLRQAHCTVEYSFITEPEMQILNNEQRGKDSATDVLSFPLFQSLRDPLLKFMTKEDITLGSVVICPSYAAAQDTSILELVHHGLLHILGFDHLTDRASWDAAEHGIIDAAATYKLTLRGVPSDYD